jgi:hypothetical protein
VIYDALLFLHLLSAFAYFLMHGAVASVAFGLKRETESVRREAFDPVLNLTYRWAPISLISLLLSGLLLSFMGRRWAEGWVWGSLGVLVAIGILMFVFGKIYFYLRFASDEAEFPSALPEKGDRLYPLVVMVRRLGTSVPMLLTVTGMLSMAIILWFMMFKPF